MFKSRVWAGFDSGQLPWNGLDLLRATHHTPDQNMEANYQILKKLNIETVRDGLPHGHSPHSLKMRLEIAASAQIQTIWDLFHFDVPHRDTDFYSHIENVIGLIKDQNIKQFCTCVINEPAITQHWNSLPFDQMLERAKVATLMLRAQLPDTKITTLSTDPLNGEEFEYRATDQLVEWGLVDCVGINTFPHTIKKPLGEIILQTFERYKLPVAISETSWHMGHSDQIRAFPQISTKVEWWQYVCSQINCVRQQVEIQGCCWYPITNTPSWNNDNQIWNNGLLDLNRSICDLELANQMSIGEF